MEIPSAAECRQIYMNNAESKIKTIRLQILSAIKRTSEKATSVDIEHDPVEGEVWLEIIKPFEEKGFTFYKKEVFISSMLVKKTMVVW